MVSSVVSTMLQVVVLALSTSVLGDVVHALLHLSLRLPAPLCWPGLLHQSHHRFLDEQLRFHDDRFLRQLLLHQIPEALMRTVVTFVIADVVGFADVVVVAVVALWWWSCLRATLLRGRDADHPEDRPLPPPTSSVVVDGSYHALHHAFPEHFFGAHVGLVDIVFGRLLPLRGRRAVVVGGSIFCRALAGALRAQGADVVAVGADDAAVHVDADVDVLVLGHGSDRRDASAYEAIIARVVTARTSSLPLEVWAVGDAPAWAARAGLFDDRVILRRLHRAPMLGARATLFMLRRGARSL